MAVVRDDRRQLDKILREVRKLRDASVTIGVHGEDSARGGGGPESNVDIAATHEFGAGRIPQRSFLRATVDGDPGLIVEAQKAADEVVHGRMLARIACERIGILALKAVRARIRAGIPPPLSPVTVKNRLEKAEHGGGLAALGGALTPLVDTGQLWQSIKYKVETR